MLIHEFAKLGADETDHIVDPRKLIRGWVGQIWRNPGGGLVNDLFDRLLAEGIR